MFSDGGDYLKLLSSRIWWELWCSDGGDCLKLLSSRIWCLVAWYILVRTNLSELPAVSVFRVSRETIKVQGITCQKIGILKWRHLLVPNRESFLWRPVHRFIGCKPAARLPACQLFLLPSSSRKKWPRSNVCSSYDSSKIIRCTPFESHTLLLDQHRD
jgi:hypothetical protein